MCLLSSIGFEWCVVRHLTIFYEHHPSLTTSLSSVPFPTIAIVYTCRALWANSRLNKIEKGAFANLTSLEELSLGNFGASNTVLRALPDTDVFAGMHCLPPCSCNHVHRNGFGSAPTANWRIPCHGCSRIPCHGCSDSCPAMTST